MASNVSAEKLVIFECSGGTFVTVYAVGRVKSGGITGFALASTKGDPNVGWRGELLTALAKHHGWVVRTYSGRLRSSPKTVRSCPMASDE